MHIDFISGFDPAATLAVQLARMVTEHPADSPGTPPAALLTVTHPTTGATHTIALPPEQARRIEVLVANEMDTCRNAHQDEPGHCGHCRGTGTARPSLAPSGPGTMPERLRGSLSSLIEYNWSKEEADYGEQDSEGRNRHIFNEISALRQWLNQGQG